MSGTELRAVRKKQGLTQVTAARRWRVSQTYLSLMEHDKRAVPNRLARLVVRAEPHMATSLVLDGARTKSSDLERLVGSLGYPGFEYLGHPSAVENPAAVVLAALRESVVLARVTEALPWVLLTYAQLDWGWLVDHARLANRQNRLGFLVSLARQLAEHRGDQAARAALEKAEQRLEDARLVKEDTLGRPLTDVERDHLRVSRPSAAQHWNVLTSLRVEHLRYAD